MFSKSQLVAAAVLVASASSIVATPLYNDVTDIEARSYTRDALLELKRRAILEYLEELDARELTTGVTTGTVAATHNGKNTQRVSDPVSHQKHTQGTEGARHPQNTHAHSHSKGEMRTSNNSKQHRPSGAKSSHHSTTKPRKDKTGEQRNTHSSTGHHVPATRESSEHGQPLAKVPFQSASSDSHVRVSANLPTSAESSPKGSHTRLSSGGPLKQAIKRSVIVYLEDLVERAPNDTTPPSATKGSTQSTTSGAKGSSSVNGGRKDDHAHRPSTSIALKADGARTGSDSSPLHHHKTPETHVHKTSKHASLRSQGSGSQSHGSTRNRRLRLFRSPYERTSISGSNKGTTSHGRQHDLTSSHAKIPESHVRVKSNEQRPPSSNAAAGSHQNEVNTHSSPAPINNQVQKQQALKVREIEELAELIARELDLYDELD